MRYWRLLPDARLRPWIQCYWWVEPGVETPAELPDLLLPDGLSELVFRRSGEFTRWQIGGPAARMASSYVIGGRSKSVLTRSPGGLRLAGVKLEPRALRSVLRMPLTGFRDHTPDFAQTGCGALLELERQVADLRSVDRLPVILDRFFLQRLGDDLDDDGSTRQLVQRLRATRGAEPILRWARENRLDARTLERRFVARMGLTPKQFARIERFKHSYRQLRGMQAESRRSRGYLDGYYDESHFDREFRHFTGTSPWGRRRDSAGFTTTIADHLLESDPIERPAPT